MVPGIPAARFGHLALLVNVTLENLLVQLLAIVSHFLPSHVTAR